MNVSVIFCDWCCAEGPTRERQCIDPTNPLPPSEGNGWSLGLCADCRKLLDARDFGSLIARHELNAGVTPVERRSKEPV